MWIVLAGVAIAKDNSQPFTITGKYIAAEQPPSKNANGENLLDVAQIKVVVSRKEGRVELASGTFFEHEISLESRIEQTTKVQITATMNDLELLSAEAVIEPGEENVAFALIDRGDPETNQLLLIHESKRAIDSSKKFTISGKYDLKDGQSAHGNLAAKLVAYEYHVDGTHNQIVFGEVLLQEGRFLIEAEVDEPKVANLTISRGHQHVWSQPVVIEPKAELTVARRGPGNWVIAAAEQGRHHRLHDSWYMSEEFFSKGTELWAAPVNERVSLSIEIGKMRASALQDLALNSKDPFDSLIALELTSRPYALNMTLFDRREKIKLLNRLETEFDQDVVARRITHRRNKIASDLARAEATEKLSVGEKFPDFTLANLDKDRVSLTKIRDEKELVLVEFWASWCVPCIAKIPKLKNLYEKFHSKGLEIVTVCLDVAKKDWESISAEHNLPWIDLGDMEGTTGPTAVAYGVNFLPTNYVVDNERNIVAKNIDLDQFGELLERRLGQAARDAQIH